MPLPPPLPAAVAADLCADGAISVANILALVHSPVVAPGERTASGWFGQTDFALCQRHQDAEGDLRDDNVFITVWKAWDFYLGVQHAPEHEGWRARLGAALRGRRQPRVPRLVLLCRPYDGTGRAGEWRALDADPDPAAGAACEAAWQGVLDYMRKALGQHRARYPLYQHLQAALTVERIEALTALPAFAGPGHDWWDSERSGWWEGDVWVAARQPCMHGGEPWGRALKLGWKNGTEAPGDAEDDAHATYQIDVDEARAGPPVLLFSCAQRQSAPREPLPRCAADHIERLLQMADAVDKRVRERGSTAPAQPFPSAANRS